MRRAFLLAGLVAALASSAAGTTRVDGGGRVVLLTWNGFLDPLWVKPFERQTGCKVSHRYAKSSDDMVRLLRAGRGRYDVVSPSGDVALRLVLARLVVRVDTRLVPASKDFFPVFRSPRATTFGGAHYGISALWSPNVLLFDQRKVKRPRSWSAVYSERYRGRIAVPNNPFQIADAALYLSRARPALGIRDPFELTREQFGAAVTVLRQQRLLQARYWTYASDEIQDFRNGDAVVGSGWPYQVSVLEAARVPVAEAAPREGMTGLIDSWMIAARARHPACAYRWLRYVSRPRVQAELALAFGETPVNARSCPFMNRIRKGSCAAFHADARRSYLSSIRFWKTPLRRCGFARRTDCVPYAAWEKAWAQIVK
jgi:putative spermidine/putrescine transport system substrate-binding protein